MSNINKDQEVVDEENIDESEGLVDEIEALTEEQEQELIASLPALSSSFLLKHKCLKLMDGKFGGGFYVRYLQDDVTKHGWLQLVIEYPDNSCKAVILCKNHYEETTFESNGMWTAAQPPKGSKIPMEWGSEDTVNSHILDKYQAPDMPIPGNVIWNRISRNFEMIPVVKINQTATLEEVYLEFARRVTEYSAVESQGFMAGSDRYYIPKTIFQEIAEANNYKVAELRNIFDMMGLFVKDKGTKGYQFSKRIRGKIKKFYVLRKSFGEAQPSEEDPILKCDSLEFETTAITRYEEEKARYSKLVNAIRELSVKEDLTEQDWVKVLV